ncbi:MAG: Maf family nucleotide pyrophosphatase [Xanthomonadaceae bacterium]|jgi:septum formation protein|nr:Maf family nucleotide pyrophosphatase [Xanthomonadaceae bacterium]
MNLVLASTSTYRQELLRRLRLPFQTMRPEVDETPRHGEAPVELVERLAQAKALHVAAAMPEAWVIGSDQVAALNGETLGKPGTRERAIAQLAAMSGCSVRFHTAVCLARGDKVSTATDLTQVNFRKLEHEEIVRYVDTEQPLDCAGSFKSEGLGIALFDAIESHDPTALIGLPLIALSKLLRQAGFRLP